MGWGSKAPPGREPCHDAQERRTFWVYDIATPHQQAIAIKDAHPAERSVVITADSNVDFEPIADVMDATRDARIESNGTTRELFDQVLLKPQSEP